MSRLEGKRTKYISYLLRFVVAGTALYLTFRGEDFNKIADELLGLNLWIFAASLGIWVLSQIIFVARWSVLMKVQSIEIGFWPAFKLHLLGIFYNNCLPTSVGGDLLRAGYVTTHTDKKLEAALSVFVDRIIGLTGLILMAICCWWFIPADEQKQRLTFSFNLNLGQRSYEYRWLFVAAGAVFTLVLLGFIAWPKGRNLLQRAFRVSRERMRVALRKIYNAIRIYCRKKWALALALLLTFCCQATFILAMWLIGREIGIGVHIKYYFIFFPIAWVVGALPISIGALGIWEGVLKFLFSKVSMGFGVSTLALCHRVIWLVGSLPGVAIHLIGAHLPRDFSIDYEDSVN